MDTVFFAFSSQLEGADEIPAEISIKVWLQIRVYNQLSTPVDDMVLFQRSFIYFFVGLQMT